MLMRKMLPAVGSAIAMVMVLASAPLATAAAAPAQTAAPAAQEQDSDRGEDNVQTRTGRLGATSNRRARAPRAPSPEENMAAAQAAATAAGLSCQVTEATLLGQTAESHNLYEASCATGPGYLITASTPPETVDCVIVAASAARIAAAPPVEGATPPLTCKLAGNQDINAVIAGYAREAGVTCQVDAGKPIGAAEGRTVYEVGCAGVDGYRLQQAATGAWSSTECLIVISAGSTCEFTTPAEQHASLKAKLVNTDAAACVVDGGRYMGGNANGVFYEAKCSDADGFVFRVKDGVTQQVYPCVVAQPIGGGCTLTPAAITAAAAAAAAAAAPPAAAPAAE